jgi:hypothetical protein
MSTKSFNCCPLGSAKQHKTQVENENSMVKTQEMAAKNLIKIP